MILLVEIFALSACLYIERNSTRQVLFLNKKSLRYVITFSLIYFLGLLAVRQNAFSADLLRQFVLGAHITSTTIFIIHPLIISVAEEFIFRFFMIKHFGQVVALVIFTLLHWRPDFPTPLFFGVFVFGLLQTYLYKITSSVIAPIISHLVLLYTILILFS